MPKNVSTFSYLVISCTFLLHSSHASSDEVSDRIQSQQRQQQSDIQQGYMQQQQQAQSDAYWAENGAAIMAADAQRRQQRQSALNEDDYNRTTDWWGAISVNVHTGAWGNALQRSSGAQAMQDVKAVCPEKDCALLALFRNTCVAGVTNAVGSAFWADDPKPRTALNLAMKKCKADPASRNSCEAPKDFNVCSGYAYQKYEGKLSNYNRGGLVGVLAPGLRNIPDLAAAEVFYNPSLLQFTGQTHQVRAASADSALATNNAVQNNGAMPPLWGAIALGMQGIGMGMGITEEIAQADALKKCEGECAIKFSFEGDFCIATGSGKKADGSVVDGIDAAKTKELVEASVHKRCAERGMECTITSLDCLDLTL